jgi:hypothetical protein
MGDQLTGRAGQVLSCEVTRAKWSGSYVSFLGRFPVWVKEVCHAEEAVFRLSKSWRC